jgi:hypothetical protein
MKSRIIATPHNPSIAVSAPLLDHVWRLEDKSIMGDNVSMRLIVGICMEVLECLTRGYDVPTCK